MPAKHFSTFTFSDYSNEKSSFSVYNGAITGASIGGFLGDFGALKTALAPITDGVLHKERWVGDDTIISQALPTDPDAQRERKMLVVYEGDTSKKKFTCTVPTARRKLADDTPLLLAGTDLYDLTVTEIAAFKTAFETIARSPDSDTETVTILEMRAVGRNI